MHALRRPDLPHVLVVTLVAAVLAIVLTLALAGSLSDLGSIHTTHSGVSAASTTHRAAGPPRWALHPFARLGGGPVAEPWSPGSPSS